MVTVFGRKKTPLAYTKMWRFKHRSIFEIWQICNLCYLSTCSVVSKCPSGNKTFLINFFFTSCAFVVNSTSTHTNPLHRNILACATDNEFISCSYHHIIQSKHHYMFMIEKTPPKYHVRKWLITTWHVKQKQRHTVMKWQPKLIIMAQGLSPLWVRTVWYQRWYHRYSFELKTDLAPVNKGTLQIVVRDCDIVQTTTLRLWSITYIRGRPTLIVV